MAINITMGECVVSSLDCIQVGKLMISFVASAFSDDIVASGLS